MRTGKALEKYNVQTNLTRLRRVSLSDGEKIDLHYCNSRANIILSDETEDCIVITSKRLIVIADKKVRVCVEANMLLSALSFFACFFP